jgi:hypothetical protein
VSSVPRDRQPPVDRQDDNFLDWSRSPSILGVTETCSAAGAIPITLMYGFDLFKKFLKVRKSLFASWQLLSGK